MLQKTGKTAYLGLGSNLGDRQANINKAIAKLTNEPGIKITGHSSVYLTKPLGVSRQPDFYNCTVKIKTTLSPESLLQSVKRIEFELGREPDTHFQPRPIDIDILLYGSLELDTLDLRIPHAKLTGRAFVLVPLLELDPELMHPVSFRPLKEYLAQVKLSQKVERVIDAGDIAEPTETD